MTPPVIAALAISKPAKVMWSRFAAAIGPESLRAAYGWSAPPPTLRPGETVWVYWPSDAGMLVGWNWPADSDTVVGWGSLIKDPTTPTYWHTSGVFPAFARQGYRQAIRQHLCGEAFARGAEAVSLVVLDGNKDHLARLHREDTAGSPWKFSGRIWSPEPGQWIFTLLREDWASGPARRREVVGYVAGLLGPQRPDVEAEVSVAASSEYRHPTFQMSLELLDEVGVSLKTANVSDIPILLARESPEPDQAHAYEEGDQSQHVHAADPSTLAREKVCCCFHLHMPDAEPACGQSG